MLYKLRLVFAIIFFVLSIAFSVYFFNINGEKTVLNDLPLILCILFGITIITTFLFGRIFCSLICPLGIFQEIITLINGRDGEKQPNYPIKYCILVLSCAAVFLYGATILSNFLSMTKIVLISGITGFFILIGIIAFFKNRLFCTDICPCGAIMGLISKFSLFKMYMDKNECLSCGMCERSCLSGCIDSCEQEIENETCVKCYKCIGKCPKGAIRYCIKKPNREK